MRALTKRASEFDEIDRLLANIESRIEQLESKNELEEIRIYRARRSVLQARRDMRAFLPSWRLQETGQ